MAVTPTRILEIEFDAGVWTDVTGDLVDLETRRGRNRESGAFETGQLVFTLRNDTRKYDPDHTAGTYYGKLRPNRRVRLRATYSAVTYPIFLGYIDRISQIAGGPNDATAQFQVSDIFKLLNRAELPVSAYAAEILTDAPVHWWPLGDPTGSTQIANAIAPAYPLDVKGAPVFGEASLAVRDPGTAIRFPTGADFLQGIFPEGTWPLTTAGTIEFLYKKTSGNDPIVGLYVLAPIPFGVDPLITVSGNVQITVLNNAGTAFSVSTTGVNLNDLATHHIMITWAAGTNIKIYVDGADRTSAAVAFSGSMANTANKWAFIINGIDYPPFVTAAGVGSLATYDEAAVYNTALSAARAAAHNAAARTPWNGDLPGTRLGRIFDLAAVPVADRNIDVGTTTLQATSIGGSALGYAQKVEETEIGWLFVARDGKVRFISRESGFTGAYLTSLATLVDDDSGAGIPYRQADADVDESIIVTRSTASREGSFAVTVYDTAAKTEFGWLDETHEGLLHNSDAYSASYAQWVLNTHKAPGSRVGTVALELTKDPAAMYPAILALELGDQVTWKRKAQNVGSVVTIPMRVEAISHETGPHYWLTRLQLSPFNLAAGLPVGVWDVSLWDQAVWGI